METHQINKEAFINFLVLHRVTYAYSEKSNKAIFCYLDGMIEVTMREETKYKGNSASEALGVYNSIE